MLRCDYDSLRFSIPRVRLTKGTNRRSMDTSYRSLSIDEMSERESCHEFAWTNGQEMQAAAEVCFPVTSLYLPTHLYSPPPVMTSPYPDPGAPVMKESRSVYENTKVGRVRLPDAEEARNLSQIWEQFSTLTAIDIITMLRERRLNHIGDLDEITDRLMRFEIRKQVSCDLAVWNSQLDNAQESVAVDMFMLDGILDERTEAAGAYVHRVSSPFQNNAVSATNPSLPSDYPPFPGPYGIHPSTEYGNHKTDNWLDDDVNIDFYDNNGVSQEGVCESRQTREWADQDFAAWCEQQERLRVSTPMIDANNNTMDKVLIDKKVLEQQLEVLSQALCVLQSEDRLRTTDNSDSPSPAVVPAVNPASFGSNPYESRYNDEIGESDDQVDKLVRLRGGCVGEAEVGADNPAVKRCRLCLNSNTAMKDILVGDGIAPLSEMVTSIADVSIAPGDGLPALVCCLCAEKLEAAYEFKLQVERTDRLLRGKRSAGMEEVVAQKDFEEARSIREMPCGDQDKSTCVAGLLNYGTVPLRRDETIPPPPLRIPKSPKRIPPKHRRRPTPVPRTSPSPCENPPTQGNPIPSLLDIPCPTPSPRKTPKPIPSLMDLRIPTPRNLSADSASSAASESSSSPSSTNSLPSRCSAASSQSQQSIFRNPSPRSHSPRHSSSPTVVVGRQLRGNGTCWRCGRRGHTHRECRAPKRWAYCYLCGERHMRVNNCPQCSASWWKAQERQRFGDSDPPDSPGGQKDRQKYGLHGRRRHTTLYERRQDSAQDRRRRYMTSYGSRQNGQSYGDNE